jgi:[acyl-carrier-protein] S-malonyltransferase
MSIAWLFPGQGSQAVGMGRGLYERSPAARATLERANEALGFDLSRLLFDGPAEDLQLTFNTQPAIMAVSLASLAALREAWQASHGEPLPPPAYVAGHSVGELAGLVASGAVDEATGLRLIRVRAEAMHRASAERPGGMTAVLGLTRDQVAEACRRAREETFGSYVDVANHNAETQVAIAGDKAGLEAAARFCQEAGARRCIPLAVSAAFHSQAMSPAAAPMGEAVARADVRDAAVPLVANVTARPITAASDLRAELIDQVASPVLWVDGMRAMLAAGVDSFIELGAGQILTNLAQRMPEAPAAIAAGDSETVARAVTWLSERAAGQ